MLKEQTKKEKKNAKWMWLTRTSNKIHFLDIIEMMQWM